MYFFSVVIPVYNRPDEIDELLNSLTAQTYTNFEVIIVEDGSTDKCDHLMEKYTGELRLQYFFKPNTGQGFSRNYGFEKSKGDYFIVFDSDCIIPSHYFEVVNNFLTETPLDAFGGPDKALSSFTATQRAISYSMTSFFTTGGIRGGKKRLGPFHPRSFNMGISKAVFKETSGYVITRMGEDIEFSIRIIEKGFKTGLIPEAYVYHKRRTTLAQFYKQLKFFGRARINVGRFYPKEVKLVHIFPMLFALGIPAIFLLGLTGLKALSFAGLASYITFCILIFLDSWIKNRSLKVAFISVPAAFTQLIAYGNGFITEGVRRLIKG
ncbi:MAG: glycosyltransferase [Bacteroidota bacterium]